MYIDKIIINVYCLTLGRNPPALAGCFSKQVSFACLF